VSTTAPSPQAAPSTPTLSPSAAALWAQCPRRWWHKYVDRLPEPPPGAPAVLGTFVHEILELLLDEGPAFRTLDRARELAREVWPSIAASEEWAALDLDEVAARRFRQRAWATVEAYFSCQVPAEVEPVARELEVQVSLDGVPFRGFIDLVERHAEQDAVVVTDYKTGTPPARGKPWSAGQEREKLWQPQWYAAALAELGEHAPVEARLLYFTAADARHHGGFEARTGVLSVEVTEQSLDEARVELRRRWDDIGRARAAGRAEATPGPLCGWCPFVAVCDDGQAECHRRWNERNQHTGGRRLRDDAPAVEVLGLRELQTA
jgi:putative RecB family exonuclease